MTTNQNFVEITTIENASPSVSASALGSVITLTYTFTEGQLEEAIAAQFDRVTVERSTDGGLTWAEVTDGQSRPVIEPGKQVYTFLDRAGADSYQYRIVLRNAATGELSDPSEAITGAGLAISGILTVDELRDRYFFGVDITNNDGTPLPDSVFEHYIIQAIRWFEREIDVPIVPTSFAEYHDYYRHDYQAFVFLKLDNHPVISIESFNVEYPTGQTVVTFPEEWWRLNPFEGQLQIVPTAGTLSEILIGQGGSFLPAIYNGMDYLPHLFRVNYTAGFKAGQVPRDIIDVIGMFASLGPFNLFGDLIAGAGIANVSLSMDGLSQTIGTTSSATNSGYGARIIQYTKQIKDQIPKMRKFYHGFQMTVA